MTYETQFDILNTSMREYNEIKTSGNLSLEVLVSSSQGNSSLINAELMIDHGLKSKDMFTLLQKRGYTGLKFDLLITHSHFDHYRVDSIMRNLLLDDIFNNIYLTKQQYDKMMVYITYMLSDDFIDDSVGRIPRALRSKIRNRELYNKFKIVDLEEENLIQTHSGNEYIIKYHEVKHDVTNYAIEITDKSSNSNLIYATDLSSTNELPKKKFNIIAIENAWNKVINIRQDHLDTLQNHLNVEQSYDYINKYLKNDGVYEELHTSGYTIQIKNYEKMIRKG